MNQPLKSRLVLLVSLLLLIISVGAYYSVQDRGEINEKGYLQSVSSKLREELLSVQDEAIYLASIIQKSDVPTFSKLVDNSDYKYYVFRNNHLYFWSDNSFAPKPELLRNDKKVFFLQQKNGKHLVYRESLIKRGDLFEIFFFIPLTKEYAIENAYLSSGLNEEIFGNSGVSLFTGSPDYPYSIKAPDGEYLFSLKFSPASNVQDSKWYWLVFYLSATGIAGIIIWMFYVTTAIRKKGFTGASMAVLFLFLAILRGMLLLLNYPFSVVQFKIFNPRYFASSVVSPSLGDLLLNIIFFFIFSVYFLNHYRQTLVLKKILASTGRIRKALSVALLVLAFYSLFCVFETLYILFSNAQWTLDITDNIDFSIFRIISLVVFVLLFGLFLVYSNVFTRLFLSLNKNKSSGAFLSFSIASIISFFLMLLLTENFLFAFLVIIGYFGIVLYLRMPALYFRFRYSSYIYLLFSACAASAIAAFVIFRVNEKTDLFNKERFANQLLVENDVLGEYLLNEAASLIRNDQFIQGRLLNPFASKDGIEQKIRRVYLGEYFDRYDIKVYVFDPNGTVYDQNADLNSWKDVLGYRADQFQTDYKDIYLIHDIGKRGFRRYLSYNKIYRNKAVIGHILIELKQKRIVPHSVYPELLVDKRFLQPWENKNYSYAIFDEDELLYSYGQYNYQHLFSPSDLAGENSLFEKGAVRNSFHHYALKSQTEGGKRYAVVSSQGYPVKDLFSNFSFFFLVLILFLMLLIVLYSLDFTRRKLALNFSTKIQIYLNLAFFLPLLIISITTLSIITSTYRENLNKAFIKKAETVTNSINSYLQSSRNMRKNGETIENLLLEKAKFIDTDVNLYDRRGRLLFSNQPLIYEMGLMSRLMNPEALSKIYDNRNNVFMQAESVGKLNYNSVYIAIRSFETGDVLGVLSIPFFESKQEVDKQLIEVLTTIVNIFVSIFLLFLFVSYFLSKLLTVPLELITQRIRRISLSGHNEPLQWNTRDEIGLLVGEYNKMLIKLQESKEALSKSEKESAWREMAKQVAHEIKNPLTPMKLSIQHLQRAVKDDSVNTREKTEKTLHILLEQVNNLNEIATSFSSFAKMPVPKAQRFDVSAVFRRIIALHSTNSELTIHSTVPDKKYEVTGDEQLMGNIFTNLLINAMQSVPQGTKAVVYANLTEKEGKVLLEVRDNGSGIPEKIRDKVFIPNFSTKYAGSGLGLAIAKRGVEHAGGRIWFETMEATGTSFFIELPLTA